VFEPPGGPLLDLPPTLDATHAGRANAGAVADAGWEIEAVPRLQLDCFASGGEQEPDASRVAVKHLVVGVLMRRVEVAGSVRPPRLKSLIAKELLQRVGRTRRARSWRLDSSIRHGFQRSGLCGGTL
jgi:hypothetical protein